MHSAHVHCKCTIVMKTDDAHLDTITDLTENITTSSPPPTHPLSPPQMLHALDFVVIFSHRYTMFSTKG